MSVAATPIRPAFTYYGGKARLAPVLAALLPPHLVYVEPFMGSAAVLLAKTPSRHEVINDRDGQVVAFYEAMRDRPDDLHRALTLTPYSREEYERCAEPGGDVVERARRFVVRCSQSVNGAGNGGSAGWALSTSRNQSRPGSFASGVDRLPEIAQRLRGVAVENRDGLDLVERFGADPCAVLYLDPPYLAATRKTVGASAYRHDAGDAAFHDRLLALLTNVKASVVLSGYPSPAYATALSAWRRVDLLTTKPSANVKGVAATRSPEVAWIKEATR